MPNSTEAARRRARARIIALGGPWDCQQCGATGAIWKAYKKYCCRECYYAANRTLQRARDAAKKGRRKMPEPKPKQPRGGTFYRARSLAEAW